jgi:hemerythrin-like domain-containing protein
MSNATSFLSQDHQDCDARWAEVEAAAGQGDPALARARFDLFHAAMERHFSFEEKTLFPAFEEATGMRGGPTHVMRHEHAQMRQVLSAMSEAFAGGDVETALDQGDTLMMLIQQHNLKEERMLYPACDAHLSQAWPHLKGAWPVL